ncbi:hypothetical protein CNECB9_980021 [Cupriavidus necator]|uniref:Uncharacterized protein n=1 Tax=Cupriavidus necator TaxID=106590 RepID=A0A1K0ITB2_CUPNE|nr:hypothetical protein CNECB9_980021 [Cupriavidus necator]
MAASWRWTACRCRSGRADQIAAYKAAFEKVHPDIEIKWVRDSTGIVTAKLLAEKAAPRADAVWGLAGSSLAILDKEGMLDAYAPKNLAAIDAKYRGPANPPAWVARRSASTPWRRRSRACPSRPRGPT